MPAGSTPYSPTGLDTYSFMVLCAQDITTFFDEFKNTDPGGNPTFPPTTSAAFAYLHDPWHWEPIGQLRADDDIIMRVDDCYFGLVMRCKNAIGPFRAGDLLVGVKGTSDLREWLDDLAAVFQVHGAPDTPGDVANGFWRLYGTLTFANLANTTRDDAIKSICDLLKDDAGLYVVGHSLGAAIATYLTYDLSQALGRRNGRLSPYFFASPKTGTGPNVSNYLQQVPFYNLINYQNDLVPRLPFEAEGFSALLPGGPFHNVMTLRPDTAAYVPALWNVPKNHSAILYARLLWPNNEVAQALPL